MFEKLVLIANLFPFEDLIEDLEKALSEYKATPSKENEWRLQVRAMIIGLKAPKGINQFMNLMEKSKQVKQAMELINPCKQ